jgi:hypothetical protein
VSDGRHQFAMGAKAMQSRRNILATGPAGAMSAATARAASKSVGTLSALD